MAASASLMALRPAALCRPVRGVAQSRRPVLRAESENHASNGTSVAYSGPLDFDELADIIRKVNETDIVDLELSSKRFNLVLKKKEALAKAEPVYVQAAAPAMSAPAMAPAAPTPAAPAPAPAAAAAGPAPAPAAKPSKPAGGMEVTSPMAGTYYATPAPGEAPFVKVGDRVSKGQTICIIEAMKLMNEIEAEVSGTVVDILVKNAEPVLPGQALLVIAP